MGNTHRHVGQRMKPTGLGMLVRMRSKIGWVLANPEGRGGRAPQDARQAPGSGGNLLLSRGTNPGQKWAFLGSWILVPQPFAKHQSLRFWPCATAEGVWVPKESIASGGPRPKAQPCRHTLHGSRGRSRGWPGRPLRFRGGIVFGRGHGFKFGFGFGFRRGFRYRFGHGFGLVSRSVSGSGGGHRFT